MMLGIDDCLTKSLSNRSLCSLFSYTCRTCLKKTSSGSVWNFRRGLENKCRQCSWSKINLEIKKISIQYTLLSKVKSSNKTSYLHSLLQGLSNTNQVVISKVSPQFIYFQHVFVNGGSLDRHTGKKGEKGLLNQFFL